MYSATVTVRELRNQSTGLDLTVPTYKVMPGLLGGTTEFSVIVITNLPYFKSPKHKNSDVIQFVLNKRYSEFEELHAKLSEAYPATLFPPLPHKGLLVSDDVLRERRAAADSFFKFIAKLPKVSSSPSVLQFLGVSARIVVQSNSTSAENAKIEEAENIIETSARTNRDYAGTSTPTQQIKQGSQHQKIDTSLLFGDVDNDDDLFFDKPDTSDVLQDNVDIFKTGSGSRISQLVSDTDWQTDAATMEEGEDEMEYDPLGGMVVGRKQKPTAQGAASIAHKSHTRSQSQQVKAIVGEQSDMDDLNDDIFIPPEASVDKLDVDLFAKDEGSEDLFTIDDDLDVLLHLEDTQYHPLDDRLEPDKPPAAKSKPAAPRKPALPAKPAGAKPATMPKPALPQKPIARPKPTPSLKPVVVPKPAPRAISTAKLQSGDSQNTATKECAPVPKPRTNRSLSQSTSSEAASVEQSGDILTEDILKYIEENEDRGSATLDLF
ncbi:PREDICTED: HCLS1-binding protein 3-like [Priapulus caudatus]|uniref:HCLS1-binding protein 3-like n=1 Tax=Priapulus caudatus TaxID=37621 RepID=A0ABM1E0I4_PRICU|nr:PREDICTED: HCLS1-binding protein 3-like [Priapulus caudatus]